MRQRVDTPVDGVDEVGLVVLPSWLVLLGATVVVDAEEDGTGCLCRRAQVDGRLPAPGADLHEHGTPSGAPVLARHSLSRAPSGGVERLPLVFWHEAADLPCEREQRVGSVRHAARA